MPNTLLLEPAGGLAGDMFLGALIDLGASTAEIEVGLRTLKLDGWEMKVSNVTRRHIGATKVDFAIPEEHVHRHLSDIEAIIGASGLPDAVKTRAIRTFTVLAQAEAKVHRIDVSAVHFHEVGAMDAILDICGGCLALELLDVDSIRCGPLPGGSGTVQCAHGEMPVPAPAVSELLEGYEIMLGEGRGEMVTPTGAALLVANGEPLPPGTAVRLGRAGYGAGSRESSLLRASLVESSGAQAWAWEPIAVLRCEVDDMTAEALAFLAEAATGAGALDVAFTPLTMKKSRPGVGVQVLARPEQVDALVEIVLRHSSSLGVRIEPARRAVLPREVVSVETPWGPVRIKVADGRGRAEYEDCAAIARAHDLPLPQVMQAAVQAFEASRS